MYILKTIIKKKYLCLDKTSHYNTMTVLVFHVQRVSEAKVLAIT